MPLKLHEKKTFFTIVIFSSLRRRLLPFFSLAVEFSENILYHAIMQGCFGYKFWDFGVENTTENRQKLYGNLFIDFDSFLSSFTCFALPQHPERAPSY